MLTSIMTEIATYPIRIRPSTADKIQHEIARRYVASRKKHTLDQMIAYAIGLAAKEVLHKTLVVDRTPATRVKRGASK